MKKLSILLLFVIIFPQTLFASAPVKLAIGDWEPFTSNRDKTANIAEIIVIEAFKLENIDVEFTYYPWKRSYDIAKHGDSDGSFPWMKTEERKKDV